MTKEEFRALLKANRFRGFNRMGRIIDGKHYVIKFHDNGDVYCMVTPAEDVISWAWQTTLNLDRIETIDDILAQVAADMVKEEIEA